METQDSLRPGDEGTGKLVAKYGDRLVCVRYRYDSKSRTHYKTVELIEEAKPEVPGCAKDFTEVAVRIGFQEEELRERVKAAGAKWDVLNKTWIMRFEDAQALDLQDRIQGSACSF